MAMKWARLFGFRSGRDNRTARAANDDPAGMGTAFGLDASVPDLATWSKDAPKPRKGASPQPVVTRNDRVVRRSGL